MYKNHVVVALGLFVLSCSITSLNEDKLTEKFHYQNDLVSLGISNHVKTITESKRMYLKDGSLSISETYKRVFNIEGFQTNLYYFSGDELKISDSTVFDSLGRKQKTFNGISKPNVFLIEQYEYDDKNPLTVKMKRFISGGTEKAVFENTMFYNEDGILETVNLKGDKNYHVENSTTYMYYSDSGVMNRIKTVDAEKDSIVIELESGGYKSKLFYEKGVEVASEIYEILEVDEHGNWTKAKVTSTYSDSSETFTGLVERKIEYY